MPIHPDITCVDSCHHRPLPNREGILSPGRMTARFECAILGEPFATGITFPYPSLIGRARKGEHTVPVGAKQAGIIYGWKIVSPPPASPAGRN
jgi:hypothetical protein